MDNTEIQRILDGLDRRLALGEIDLGTYHQLKAKFSAQAVGTQEPLAAAISAIPKEGSVIRCPGCMAPLPPPSDPSQANVICEYCGGTFSLQIAAEEMEHLRKDIRRWISEVAGSAGVGTTVDEASRRFIFNDKFLPMLRTATDRATELFVLTRHQPIFAFSLLAKIHSSPFHQALECSPPMDSLVTKVKEVVARVQSPEIKVFAVGEKEKGALYELEIRCLETAYLSNVRLHLATFTPDGLKKAKTNLRALSELYSTAGKSLLAIDPSFARFCSGLNSRVKAVEHAVDILGHLYTDQEGVMTDQVIANLESAAAECERAASEIESSGREPRETVAAADGTNIDAESIRILGSCVRLFGQCGAETGESFTGFMTSLEKVVDQANHSSSDLPWIASFMSSLGNHISSMLGESPVPVIQDFGWVEATLMASARSSMFGGKETGEVEKKILAPFWVAELNFSQQKGMIFKKGQEARGLLILEGARQMGQCHLISYSDPLVSQCHNAIKAPRAIGQSIPAAIPVVSADSALRHMKQTISTTEGLAGASAKLLGLIYLPMATARYSTRKGDRTEALLPAAGAQIKGFTIERHRLGTKELMQVR